MLGIPEATEEQIASKTEMESLNYTYKIDDRRSDDEILHLAGIISGEERKRRTTDARTGNVMSPQLENEREKRYRPIIEWIRGELWCLEKPHWKISKFYLKVDPDAVQSSVGIDKPDWGQEQPKAFVKLPGKDLTGKMLEGPIGIEYLWPLFHEFGHVLMGSPEHPKSIELYGEQYTCERETHAWNFGWFAVKDKFPAFLNDQDCYSYLRRMNEAIKTYLKNSKKRA